MSAAETLALLERRVRAIPAALTETLAARVEAPAARRFAVTGGGLSEGPARFLVALLAGELGLPAAYWPLSEFAAPSLPKTGDTLVLFSQGLAPNARLPLEHLDSFAGAILFTSVRGDASAPEGDVRRLAADAARRGVQVVTLPPVEESGLLLRVLGPATATLAAALLGRALGLNAALEEVPALYAHAAAPLGGAAGGLVAGGQLAPVALVAGGRYLRALFGLRWKLLEGLHVSDPPIWDLLQVAHGPFQSFYDSPMTLLVLEHAGAPHEAFLVEKLAEVLAPERHRLLRLRARHAFPLAWFEHDAAFDALLLDALRAHPIDLARWPGLGHDGPLYELATRVRP